MSKRVLGFIVAGCLGLASFAEVATATTVTVVTDNTWEVTTGAAYNGTTPSLGSIVWGGTTATASFAFGPLPGIWDASPSVETLLFRQTFTISGTVLSASLQGGADDDLLDFWINGTHYNGEASGFADALVTIADVTAALVNGQNTITIRARNTGGPATAAAQLSIDVASPVPLPAALPLFSLVLGIGGLLGWRKGSR